MTMLRATIVAAAAAAVFAAPVRAQTFPDHPIKLVVAYPPGGPNDTVTRVTTQGLGAALGQNVFIENVPGAGGRIGARDVARATPDGYTLLAGGTNINAIAPALYKTIDFDPVRDFAPVAALSSDSTALVINPSVPATTLAELVRYGKEHPGKLNAGSTLGIAPHLLIALVRVRTGIDMTFVPYKGAAPAIADVVAGQIQVAASGKAVLLPLIKAGKLRAIAVASAERWPELPEAPTLRESGIDGFPTAVWDGLVAPAKTPPAIIAKINAAENARLRSPEIQAAVAKLGFQVRPLSPQQFGTELADQVRLWSAVARETGVKLDE
ncbi:MAG TPA: tripartite tricarboxylate transporter substrate binding protein [Xanthobacteraceae bacterium]|nr:tripartite tricarboxylate transporter substrate binding protein [Xanthobacteraceae bacterium]